jgi:predicted nucleotidyltransferase
VELLDKNREAISKLCTTFKVDELYAFGSVLTDKFSPKSDVDFIVSIISSDPIEYAENYFHLKFELEKLLKRNVDLLEEKAFRTKTFENLINKKKVLIYAGRDQGVA